MNAPGRDPGTVEATRQLLRSAFEEAERMLSGKDVSPKSRLVAGRDPGRLLEDLTGHAPPPERPFDWKTAMRMFAAKSRAPVHTYARPNRRFPSRVGEIPGRTYAPRALERPSLLVAIDTSTSMTDRELSEVSRELSVLSEHARVTIVECDVEITRVYAFEGRLESVAGRGGTDLRPVFEADFLGSHRADGVIYFTDGIGPLPETAPRLPVLWVLTKPGELACSWGQKVRLAG
jgi:predicted metal-dependent peptidase